METLGISATKYRVNDLPIDLPEPTEDGRIPTINKMGYMSPDLLPITNQFVTFCSQARLPVFDGGAAFGISSLAALKAGGTVVMNDIDCSHMLYLSRHPSITEKERSRLYFKEGSLPYEINFPNLSLSAVHLSRVIHFFTPEMVSDLFQKVYNWLEPNGHFFIIVSSPYFHSIKEGFSEIYEERYRSGMEFPGVQTEFPESHASHYKNSSSAFLHSFDPRVIVRLADKYNFIPKLVQLFGGPDDMDYTGAILIKK